MHLKKTSWELKLAVPIGLGFILFGILNSMAFVICAIIFSILIGIYIGKLMYAVPFTKNPQDYGYVKHEEMIAHNKDDEPASRLNYAPAPGQIGDKDYRARLNRKSK